jgi:GDP-L-fucose synthase
MDRQASAGRLAVKPRTECKITTSQLVEDPASTPLAPLDRRAPIFVAGHRGLVGSAIWERCTPANSQRDIGRASAELALRDRRTLLEVFDTARPVSVVLAAGLLIASPR